jgi:hypothetical protein
LQAKDTLGLAIEKDSELKDSMSCKWQCISNMLQTWFYHLQIKNGCQSWISCSFCQWPDTRLCNRYRPLGEFDLALSICPIHDQTYCSTPLKIFVWIELNTHKITHIYIFIIWLSLLVCSSITKPKLCFCLNVNAHHIWGLKYAFMLLNKGFGRRCV